MVRSLLRALLRASTWRLALRNVGRNPRRTLVVLTSVTVGLGAMVLAMAVNYGMIYEMVRAAIRTELGHVQVHAVGYGDQPGIEHRFPERDVLGPLGVEGAWQAWAPRLRGEGLVYSPRASVGVSVIGIDPAREAEVSSIAESMVEGAYLDGVRRRLLLGERLARRLKVGVGDKVVLSAQDVSGEMTGEAFRVSGLFRTPSRQLDETAVYLRLDEGQALYAMEGELSEAVFVAPRQEDSAALKGELVDRLGGPELEIQTWSELRPMLQAMIDVFSQTGWIIYAAIFIAMAFGIANVLLMSVYERTREIGILMAIGMPPGRMVAIVLVEAWIMTGVGVALGLGLGMGGVELLSDGIDLSRWTEGLTAFGIPPRIRPEIPRGDLWAPIVIAFVTAVVASLWPAIRAVRTRPAEAVRTI